MNQRILSSRLIVAGSIAALTGMLALKASAQTYDLNAAYLSNETGANGADPTNSSFGGYYGVGYTLDPPGTSSADYDSGFTPFTPDQYTSNFANFGNTQGFSVPNNVLVPAAVIDVSPTDPGYGGLNPSEILLHPGNPAGGVGSTPFSDAVARFTAPADGTYEITGDYRSLDIGAPQDVILQNGTPVYSVSDQGPVDVYLHLTAGDHVDFAVSAGGSGSIGSDSTGLTAKLQVVPAPAPKTQFVNIDFDGQRADDATSAGTYVGVGAAGGGTVFNSLSAVSAPLGGTNNDNISASASGLLESHGNATNVGFTIQTVGADANPNTPPQPDPTSPQALFGDYLFVGSAGQTSKMANFEISGLGDATTVDLYFYTVDIGGTQIFLNGLLPTTVTPSGIFDSTNTIYFQDVPVVDGVIDGIFETPNTGILNGMTIAMVPEPGVGGLLGTAGLVGLWRQRRRGVV